MWKKIPYWLRRKIGRWMVAARRLWHKFQLSYRFFQDDLYDFSERVNPLLRFFSILLSILVFGSLMLPLLLPEGDDLTYYVRFIEQSLLIAFGLHFLSRIVFSVHKGVLLRQRWMEGLTALCAFLLGLDMIVSNGQHLIAYLESAGINNPEQILLFVIQLYLILLVCIKIVQVIPEVIADNTNPARLVLLSFLSVIIAGMLLLMLPAATVDGEGLPFVDALFTATSAVCVTGLIVVDTATHFTLFGQSVILILIQLGGIGVITFATFLALYLSGGIGIYERHVIQNVVPQKDVRAITKTLKRIVIFTLGVEAIGMAGYYFSWTEAIPDVGERLFFSVFHAISAFCNAGFSVYTNSLSDPFNATALDVNIITMVLIIIGGLGFTTVWELVRRQFAGGESVDRRRWTLHSLIVLRMTIGLIVVGLLLVLILEWDGVLAGYSLGEQILFSLFQSVTARTAGFNTLDTSALGTGVTLIVIILMAIGASPSSTAGGLKTTTVYVLFASMMANIMGKDRLEIAHRTVPNQVIFRAISSVLLAVITLTICTIILSITEDFPFLDILFEQISAFMTVGLSRGITGELSEPGKLVIVVSMFMGRVGLLTFAVAFAAKVDNRNYRYPEESIMVA